MTDAARKLGRLEMLDSRPINLDGFSVPDSELGLVALASPGDPAPTLVIADGRVVEMDGRPEADFDIIDELICPARTRPRGGY